MLRPLQRFRWNYSGQDRVGAQMLQVKINGCDMLYRTCRATVYLQCINYNCRYLFIMFFFFFGTRSIVCFCRCFFMDFPALPGDPRGVRVEVGHHRG